MIETVIDENIERNTLSLCEHWNKTVETYPGSWKRLRYTKSTTVPIFLEYQQLPGICLVETFPEDVSQNINTNMVSLWMCRQTATATKPTSDMPWNTSWFTTGSLFHGLLWTLYKGVVLFHPLYRANNQGLGRCLGLRLRHLTIAQDCHTEESLLMCQKHISQKHLKNTSWDILRGIALYSNIAVGSLLSIKSPDTSQLFFLTKYLKPVWRLKKWRYSSWENMSTNQKVAVAALTFINGRWIWWIGGEKTTGCGRCKVYKYPGWESWFLYHYKFYLSYLLLISHRWQWFSEPGLKKSNRSMHSKKNWGSSQELGYKP